MGGWRCRSSALDRVEWSASRLSRFTPRKKARGAHRIGDWVSPRSGLEAVKNKKIPAGNRSPIPRQSRHLPVATPAEPSQISFCINIKKYNNNNNNNNNNSKVAQSIT
jgi:hypothetical protein